MPELASRLDSTAPQASAAWVSLDDSGCVVAAGDATGRPFSTVAIGTLWDAALTPGSRALWVVALWPALLRSGRLDDVMLELQGQRYPWLSCWWREANGFKGWLLRNRERQQLLQDLQHARQSLTRMPGAVLQLHVSDPGTLVVSWASEGLLDLLGVTAEAAVRDSRSLIEALSTESQLALHQQLLASRHAEANTWRCMLVPARWPERSIELSARWEHQAWHAVLTDVSDRERLQRALLRQARTDGLTQLANRTAMLEFLHAELGQGRGLALLLADCDRFKQVNDTLGHAAGDELLRHLGARLRNRLRLAGAAAAEPVVARFGGDEFVVAVPAVTGRHAAMAVAERLNRLCAEPFQLGPHTVRTTMSVGVVVGGVGDEAHELLQSADMALYEAKRRGRGCAVMFDPAMRDRVMAAAALESDLREALRQAALRPVFQPIVEIGSGRVVGLEALARWRHPARGEVPAGQFVAVAEESGLAGELGLCMLRKVCAQIALWRAQSVPLPERVSVNLSRAQLRDAGLVARITETTAQAGVPASQLQFEVTESLAMDDEQAVIVLHQLREQGYRLALDDFGTGHSSLASLPKFPVQQLKIDRSFVGEMVTSGYHRALVQAALQVAHALGLEVVAEGVETEAQAQALAGLGCTRAQGWLYAKALESADVPALLARGAPPLGPARRATEVVAHASRAHQVVVTDAQGRTVFVNAAFTLNTGYTLADMAGRSPGSVLQGADTDPAAVHVLREAVRSGVGCMGVEIVNHRKDGSPFAVRLDIEPVRDASGKVLEFVSVQTEVSELRQVRSDLATIRRREDEIRALGIVGFWERDLRTGQARWDNNTRRMLGRLAHEAELGWAEALAACTPETRPALQAYIDALSAGQTSGVLEYTLVHRDGREVDLLSRWRREGDRILGITVDVSGGTRRRNAAQVQLHLMALATEAAQQLCWVADLASDRLEWLGTSRLAAWDALRACEDWGQLLQRVLPQDRTRLLTARAAALKGSDSVELEFGIELAGGEVLSLQSRQCALRDAAGHAQHLVGVLMDITPRFRQPVRLRELERRHDIEHAAAGQGVFRFDVAAQRFDVD